MQPRLRRDGRDGIGGDSGSRTEVLHTMHDPLDTPQSLSVSQYEPAPTPTPAGPNVASFATDHERREWLIGTLGEAFCRKIGVYRIPDDLVLSVVIPVYNEQQTIHEILDRVRAVPINKQIIVVDDCSTDGTREILREIAERRTRLDGRLPRGEPGQRRRAAHRLPARHRRHRDRPGRRPRIRARAVSRAHPADRRGSGRRRLRLAVHRRDPPRALFLAFAGQQVTDAAVEHVHQPEPDRHGGLLQGFPPRGDPGDHAARATGSASSPR